MQKAVVVGAQSCSEDQGVKLLNILRLGDIFDGATLVEIEQSDSSATVAMTTS